METLYGPAAALLKGAADTNTDTANREAKTNQQIASTAQTGASDRLQQKGAMDRQVLAGQQNMQQILETAKQNALAEKAKYEMEHSFVMDKDTAAGLAKTTGNSGFAQMEGQRVPAKDMLALGLGLVKSKFTKGALTDVDLGSGPQKVMVRMVEDENGTVVPEVTVVGKSVPKGSGGKTPEEKDNKELTALEEKIGGTNKALLAEIKRGNIPEEAWGGEPGNMRKLEQFVSAGNFGNLDSTQKARVSAIGGLMTKMKEQNTRANEVRTRLKKDPTDYTGFGQQAAGGDAALLDWMKQNKVKDTPANRQWAKGKMGNS